MPKTAPNIISAVADDGMFDGTQRAEHPDHEPDLNFKMAKAETDAEQQSLDFEQCGVAGVSRIFFSSGGRV